MRVAIIPMSFPVVSETFVINMVTGLLDRGHEVDILPWTQHSRESNSIHPAVNKYQLVKRTFYPPQMPAGRWAGLWLFLKLFLTCAYKDPLASFKLLDISYFNKGIGALPLACRKLFFSKQKPYDIIHFQFGEAALKFQPFRSMRAFRGKWVTHFRGYDISVYIQKNGKHVYDELFKDGDLFLSNSHFFKQRLVRLGCPENKVLVYYSGVDCDKFIFRVKPLVAGQRIKIVTVGRLVEKKGIEYGIRAVAQLKKNNIDVEYAVVGEGPLREEMQQLIAELCVGDCVKLLGSQNQEEIIAILTNAHIFIAPSVTAHDGDQDGPDNTLKEAMAVGLPVIAGRSGAIPEVVEHGKTGFLVPERDAEAIASQIRYLLDHPEVWSDVTKKARAFIEQNYDLNKLNDQLVQIYKRLLE